MEAEQKDSESYESRILPTKFAVAGEEEYLTNDKQVSKKIIISGEKMPA